MQSAWMGALTVDFCRTKMPLRSIRMAENETPIGEISMAAVIQGCRATAKAAVAEARRVGCHD